MVSYKKEKLKNPIVIKILIKRLTMKSDCSKDGLKIVADHYCDNFLKTSFFFRKEVSSSFPRV